MLLITWLDNICYISSNSTIWFLFNIPKLSFHIGYMRLFATIYTINISIPSIFLVRPKLCRWVKLPCKSKIPWHLKIFRSCFHYKILPWHEKIIIKPWILWIKDLTVKLLQSSRSPLSSESSLSRPSFLLWSCTKFGERNVFDLVQ